VTAAVTELAAASVAAELVAEAESVAALDEHAVSANNAAAGMPPSSDRREREGEAELEVVENMPQS
jgi:hypothetical protein